jgi:hypothetical protein
MHSSVEHGYYNWGQKKKKKQTNMHHSRLAVATIAGLGFDQNKRKRLP